jgi:hypothetical protein
VSLYGAGLDGALDGTILCDLLLNNSQMRVLWCSGSPLGSVGARALHPGIQAIQILVCLGLHDCSLRDEGVLAVANALADNNILEHIASE